MVVKCGVNKQLCVHWICTIITRELTYLKA